MFYNREILIFNFSVVLTIPKATSQPSSIFKGDGETAAILGSSSCLHPPGGRPQLSPHCSTQHHWKASHVTLAARSLTASSVKGDMVGMGGGGHLPCLRSPLMVVGHMCTPSSANVTTWRGPTEPAGGMLVNTQAGKPDNAPPSSQRSRTIPLVGPFLEKE